MADINPEDLQDFGLSEYEAKIYLTLVRYGRQKVSDAADRSGTPRNRAYDVLESLEEKGLVSKVSEDPIRYSPIDPDKSLGSLIDDRMEKLKEFREQKIDQLSAMKQQNESEDSMADRVETVIGRKNIFDYYSSWIQDSEEEIQSFGLFFEVNIGNKVNRIDKELVENGVDYRLIVTDYPNEQNARKAIEFIGMEAREYNSDANFYLIVRDREEAMMVLINPLGDPENEMATVYKEESIAEALAEFQDRIWKESEPLDF